MPHQEPVDLLIAFEEASEAPIRPEYLDGMVVVPRLPDFGHTDTAGDMAFQIHAAGLPLVGRGNGYRAADKDGVTLGLLIPDFYVLRRKMPDADESHYAAHKGWYPIETLALVGAVASAHHEMAAGPKFRIYAAARVPVYVLINRTTRTAHCHTEPVLPDDDPAKACYTTGTKVPLGASLPLPAPFPALRTKPWHPGPGRCTLPPGNDSIAAGACAIDALRTAGLPSAAPDRKVS
ncbi:Uma2 family endonuclease [Streptomyces sp. NPDC056716]|uniref:Uma2 family endonuclease n=1 Tax=unclassified Streptomyces TaxID=2593676 RepID=UPI003693CAE4